LKIGKGVRGPLPIHEEPITALQSRPHVKVLAAHSITPDRDANILFGKGLSGFHKVTAGAFGRQGIQDGLCLEFSPSIEDIGDARLSDADVLHQFGEGHEVNGGAQYPGLAPPVLSHGQDKMGQTPESEKDIADIIVPLHDLPEPLGLGIKGLAQFKRSRISHLHPPGVHHTQVHKDGAVLFLKHLQAVPEEGFITELFVTKGLCQGLDVGQLLFQEIVDVLPVLFHQFFQVGIDLCLIGLVELVEDGGAHEEHRGNGDDKDGQDHIPGQGVVITVSFVPGLIHVRALPDRSHSPSRPEVLEEGVYEERSYQF